MRDDYDNFVSIGASIIAVSPESPEASTRYLRQQPLPFPIVCDVEHVVFDSYDVASRALSLGQRPAVFVIDHDGIVRFDAVGTQQWQIPTNGHVLEVLAGLAPTSAGGTAEL